MREEDQTVLGCLGIVAYFVVVVPLAAIFRGFALVKLWAWFLVVPFGVRPINIALAYGISCIVGLLTYQSDAATEHKDEAFAVQAARSIMLAVLVPALSLLAGWIAKQFM